MNLLEKANVFISENKHKIVEQFRPEFHLAPEYGWMNDPNGFVYFNGEYHLFYQSNPYDSKWDTMHWGHAKSKDLIEWEHLPVALAPDQPYDKNGCFSGSAIVVEDELVLMYTGVTEDNGQSVKFNVSQHQKMGLRLRNILIIQLLIKQILEN